MTITINTNTQSLFAQRALNKNTGYLRSNIEHLSTGFRVNKAADDAAGLSISEKMTAEIRGLDKAAQNSLDGISLVQTMEGALGIIQDNLQRIRELMVQAQNGTNGIAEVNALQREANARITTIEDVAKSAKFNGVSLLFQPAANIVLQSGANNGETTTIKIVSAGANQGVNIDIDAAPGNGNISEGAVNKLSEVKIATTVSILTESGNAGANDNLANMDARINNVSRMRSELGAIQNSLESKIEYLKVAAENVSASRSRIKDVDVASESSLLVKNQILQQSAAAMLSQANATPQIALNLLP